MKIEIIKERASAGFRIGDILEMDEMRASRYIAQGYAKEYKETPIEESQIQEPEIQESLEEVQESEKIEVKKSKKSKKIE